MGTGVSNRVNGGFAAGFVAHITGRVEAGDTLTLKQTRRLNEVQILEVRGDFRLSVYDRTSPPYFG